MNLTQRMDAIRRAMQKLQLEITLSKPLHPHRDAVREGVSNGIALIIQRDACCRSQHLGGLMLLIDSDNKICILRRTADGHTPDRRLAVEVSNGAVRLKRRDALYRSYRLGGLMHSIDSDNKICILRRTTKAFIPSIHLDRRTRAAAELLAAWTCVAQTRTQEGAERAKERRRKIQGRAGTQSICAPAGARVLDDAYISQRRRCRAEQMASKRQEAPT